MIIEIGETVTIKYKSHPMGFHAPGEKMGDIGTMLGQVVGILVPNLWYLVRMCGIERRVHIEQFAQD